MSSLKFYTLKGIYYHSSNSNKTRNGSQLGLEINAIINYFTLLEKKDLSRSSKDTFESLKGNDYFTQLIQDIQQNHINIFSSSVKELILRLESNLKDLKSMYNFELRQPYFINIANSIIMKYQNDKNTNDVYANIYNMNAYDCLVDEDLPITEDQRIELESLKPKQKKIG